MKRKSFLAKALLMLFAVLFSFTGARADEVTIGSLEGAVDDSYLPMNSLYNYSYSQQIYTAEEIGKVGTITSVTMWLRGNANLVEMPFDIYMVEVDKDAFESATDWVNVTNADIVYSGSVTVHNTDAEAYTFELDTPFSYSGSSNLLIAFNNKTGNWKTGLNGKVFAAEDGFNRALYARQDASAYDPTAMSAISANGITAKRDVVTFEIIPGGGPIIQKPATFEVYDVTAHEATLTWTGGTGTYNVEYKKSADEEWIAAAKGTEETTITLTGLAQQTSYDARVQSVSGSNLSGWKTLGFTTLISCPAPTGLKCAYVTGDGTKVILSWSEEGEATAWQICLNDNEENLIDADENPYEVTGLTPETLYTAKVRAVGDGEYSVWSEAISFEPTEKVIIGEGTATSVYLPSYIYYKNSLTQQIYTADELGAEGKAIESIAFYCNTATVRNLDIYMVGTDKESFESNTDWVPVTADDLVYSGEVSFEQNAWTTITLDNVFALDGKNVVLVVDDNTGSYVNGVSFRVFEATAQALRVYSDNTNYDPTDASGYTGGVMNVKNQLRVGIGEPPTVLKPTGLKVSYEGGTEATISWNSDEEAWDIEVNGEVTKDVDNPTTLTDLKYATVYNIRVRAKNESGVSDWTSPVSFATDLTDDWCQIQLFAMDSYGDGWAGSNITITDVLSGIEIGTYTVTSEAGKEVQSFVIDVPNDRDIQFTWPTLGQWDSECVYAAYDINEEEIFSGSGAFSEPIIWHVNCLATPWRTPSDLAATEVGPYSAKLSWTENSVTPATSWVVAYKAYGETDSIAVTVDANPYVLEGLTPNVAYTVKVRPNTDEVEKWSREITFTTYFAEPAELAADNITATSAEITWNGDASATNFELQYVEGPVFTPASLKYDDNTCAGTIGNSNAGTWTWGVMYPGNMVTGNVLTQVSVYETSQYNLEDITINIYQGGDTAPETLLYTETVATEHADAFHNVTLATPVEITPGKNLWITLTETGTYVMSYFATDEPNSQWVYSGGEWGNIGDLAPSLAGDGWMIRAELDSTIDPESYAWTTVTDATSPVELTDLKSDTEYFVRVKAIYGTDGESDWASTRFATLEAFASPTDLAVSEIGPRSAKLSWTENGEATAWEICLNNDEENLIAADSNPFTVESLTPETDYTVKVRAIDGEKKSKWCDEVAFTTDIALALPSDFAVNNIEAKSAEISWTGFGESYNLRYRAAAEAQLSTDFEDSSMGEWTTIDADGDGYTWVLGSECGGVYLVEGSSLADSGNGASKDLVVSGSYSNMSGVGALEPDNYLVSPKVALGGSISFYACAQDGSYAAEHFGVAVSTTNNTEPAAFTMVEEWTMTSTGAPASSRRKAQGSWGLYTVDLSAFAGQEGYVAIRHFNCTDQFMLNIDDIVIRGEAQPWTTVNDVTSPYTLDELTPETDYEVAVQAVYTEGESEWVSTSFTTPEFNPVPSNIVADLVADGATITWDGTGDSYQVAYMALGQDEMFFYDDFDDYTFDDGLYSWTIYTNGGSPFDEGWLAMEGGAYSFSQYDQNYAADNWLISPAVDLKGTLAFYANAPYGDEYEVLLSTTGTAVEDFTIELQPMAAGPTSWSLVTIDLSSYEGQKGYIAIHHVFNGANDGFYLGIENFGIYGDGYTDSGEIQFVETTEPTVTLSGLDTNNAYAYIIRSIREDAVSAWSEQNEFALLTLANDADNISLINNFNRMQAHVTLADRTFFQDNTWNTVCLPFDLTPDEVAASALAEADIRTLQGITVDGESTTLNFTSAGYFDSEGFWGGCPMIVRWDGTSNLEVPTFANVTITNKTFDFGYEDTTSGLSVTFKGTYAPLSFSEEVESILFIGENNKINHPLAGAFIGSQRGYFEVEGLTSAGIKQFNTNLGDEDPTSIADINVVDNSDWYDLSGRKLAGKPSMKGIYVNGGRKVTVK